MIRIPLMRDSFLNNQETKQSLITFIGDLKSDRFSMGTECAAFEAAFAERQKRRFALLCNSGSSANLILLQALKNLGRLKEGDSIGFSAVTWSTNVMPILQIGCIPVPIDCEIDTLNVSSVQILKRLQETNIQALFLTNVMGFAGDLALIQKLCKEKNILLLEDNCESLGTELASGITGNFGIASTFSFFVGHHMSTIEGGMVVTDDADLAEMLAIVRTHGWDRNLKPEAQERWRKKYQVESDLYAKYTFYDLGFNLRPTEITGVLGLVQLPHLDESLQKRGDNYCKVEKWVIQNKDFIPLTHEQITLFAPFAIPFVTRDKNTFDVYTDRFAKAGIEIRPIIAGNIQRQPFYAKYVHRKYPLPQADHIHEYGFYAGNDPQMTDDEIKIVTDCLAR